MKILREISLLFKRKMTESLRQPVWILSSLMTPLLYLALFSPLLKPMLGSESVFDVFVPGMLTLMAFSSGMGAGWNVVWELQSGVIERLRVSPASRFSLLMGTVLKDVTMFVATALIVIVISSLFDFHPHWGGLIILLIMLSMLTAVVSAWSQSLGLIIKDIGGLASVVTSLQLPITLLSGILLPLSLGPKWIQILAHINPLYYTVEASRVLTSGTIYSMEMLKAFLVMVPLTVTVLWWATRVYRKTVT